MKWLGRKFNRKTYEVSKTEVPFSTITRWALYDLSVEEPNEIAVTLGLTPVSEEGNKKEEDDSSIRLEELDNLLPFMDIISELNAKIVVAVQRRDMLKEGLIEDEELGDEEILHMTDFYKSIGFSALVTAFSAGINLDILHASAIGTRETYKEDDE